MNYIIIFFLLCAVRSLRGVSFSPDEEDFLASVREYPLMIHKCTASFIREDVLVTTASCLFCEGYCTLFVQVTANRSLTLVKEKSRAISHTIIHPEYEIYPHKNDIGLIVLTEEAWDAVVFDLPEDYFNPSGIHVNVYSWQFSEEGKDFRLQTNAAKGISNMMCSLVSNQYIDDTNICVLGKKMLSLGGYDQGTALAGKIGESWFLLGIYDKRGIYREVKVEVFQSIIPHIDWINGELKKLEGPPSKEDFDLLPSENEHAFFNSNPDSYVPHATNNWKLKKNNMFSLPSEVTTRPITTKVTKYVTLENSTASPYPDKILSPTNIAESSTLPTQGSPLVKIPIKEKFD